MSADNAGSYTVVIRSPYGSVTSSVATLTVLTPPSIAAQPASQAVCLGSNATFSVAAFGDAPLACSWYFDATNLLQAGTNTGLIIGNCSATNAGSYTVVVTNDCGAVTSQVATLSILDPFIVTQPQSQTTYYGLGITFSVSAAGTMPIYYQWQFKETNIAGATDTTLTLTNVQSANAGAYRVVVSNAVAVTNSANATLTVLNPAPVITLQPVSQSVYLGSYPTVSLRGGASGSGALWFQWRCNGTNLSNTSFISGANTLALTISSFGMGQAGAYSLLVTNSFGAAKSSNATITIMPVAAWGWHCEHEIRLQLRAVHCAQRADQRGGSCRGRLSFTGPDESGHGRGLGRGDKRHRLLHIPHERPGDRSVGVDECHRHRRRRLSQHGVER